MHSQLAGGADRRVAVTGLGAVSGLGWGIEPLWRGLRRGQNQIAPFSRFDHTAHRTHLAAEVPPPPADLLAAVAATRHPHQISRADLFALAAACEAAAAAGLGLPLAAAEAAVTGVFFGSSTGGMWESEGFLGDLLAGRPRASGLEAFSSQQVNGPGDAVARHLRVAGPVQTSSSACASGALALGVALEAVRQGEVEVAIAGGSDSLCQLTYAGFNALRSVDERPCRPFRANRQGMSIGEGAAVLVLEPLCRALGRGAVPLALLAGAGASCDAHHMTAPDPTGRGAAAALDEALRDAGLSPEAVDFVNSHGTGTALNDAAEWLALARVFGERAGELPVEATKSLLGHLLGSAGALEAVVTVLSLNRGELHPVAVSCGGSHQGVVEAAAEEVDPATPVALVRGAPRHLPAARVAVSTSLAFGGSNAALVFTRWMGQAA